MLVIYMEIAQFQIDINESLAESCKFLGDFQLFVEVSHIDSCKNIEDEIEQIFREEMERLKAYDIRYEFNGPFNSSSEIKASLNRWFNVAGLGAIKATGALTILDDFISSLSPKPKFYELANCTYLKKGIAERIEYRLYYNYFLVKNEVGTLAFEIGGDD
jgi:hypothetical protein